MLVPGERIHNALKEDYQAMHNMIYAKMPEYEEIIGYLCKLEEEVHELEQQEWQFTIFEIGNMINNYWGNIENGSKANIKQKK